MTQRRGEVIYKNNRSEKADQSKHAQRLRRKQYLVDGCLFLIRSTHRNPLLAMFLCSSRTPGKERKKSKKDTDKRRSSYTRRIDKKCKIKLTKHKG